MLTYFVETSGFVVCLFGKVLIDYVRRHAQRRTGKARHSQYCDCNVAFEWLLWVWLWGMGGRRWRWLRQGSDGPDLKVGWGSHPFQSMHGPFDDAAINKVIWPTDVRGLVT